MISYQKSNIINALPLSDIRFGASIAEQVECFFTERHRSDFAKNEIYAETEEAFRLREDDSMGPGFWRGEFWGKWVISSCRIARYENDAVLKEFLHQAALNLIATADENGYIGTYKDPDFVVAFPVEQGKAIFGWNCTYNWSVWCRKYTLWGLLECYDLTGDEKILAGAVRMADHLLSSLKRLNLKITDCGIFRGLAAGSIMKPLLILYRITSNKQYLDAAFEVANDFEREDGLEPNIITNALSMKPIFDWYPIEHVWAKAYEMMSCLDGILELYRVTGIEKYLQAVKNMYTLLMQGEFNTVLSVGFNDRFESGATKPNAISEPCDVIHWIRICSELYRLTGDVKYVESIELAFYNPMLASFFRDGKWGARGVRTAGRHMVAHGQSYTTYSHCCVNNIPRGILNAAEMFVLRRDDALIVNMYSDFEAKTEATHISISGSYLSDGNVTLTIDSKAPVTLLLRVPAWATFAKINGKDMQAENGYCTVLANEGKTVYSLSFGMKIVLRELETEPEHFPPESTFIRRFTQPNDNFVDESLMTWDKRATLLYGPLLLTRSKLCGNTEEEIFESESVAHQGYEISVQPIEHENVRAAFKVTFKNEKKTLESVMCDYASGSNIASEEDMKLFNVFI